MRRLPIRLSVVLLIMAAQPALAEVWRVPESFATLQEVIDSPNVMDGDIIIVGPGRHAGAEVTKSLIFLGMRGAIIDSGPTHPSGLQCGFLLEEGSDQTRIALLTFEVDLPIMNGAAVDEVFVTLCTFNSPIQGVSNWGGNGWKIRFNKIVDLRTTCGSGIGILIGEREGGVVQSNVVTFNVISGTLHVTHCGCEGYNGSGIVLYADFSCGREGATTIGGNSILLNKISLVSDDPDRVGVAAIALTDNRDDPNLIAVQDNVVILNDLRGTDIAIELTPDTLDQYNTIGPNRQQ